MRFGNFFETGHQFQLTGIAYPGFQGIFATKFIFPNFYNMFFRPPKFSSADFPFVFAPSIKENMWPWFIRIPEKYYYSEPVVGLFTGVPVLCLISTPFIGMINEFIKWMHGISIPELKQKFLPIYKTWWIVLIGLIGNVFSIAMYLFSTMRYLADIVPLMIIYLAICVWWEIDHLRNRPVFKYSFLYILVFSSIVSIFFGVLVNFPF